MNKIDPACNGNGHINCITREDIRSLTRFPSPEKTDGKTKERPEGICQAHWDEWVKNSAVKPEITALSIESIEDKQIIAERLGWKAYHGDKGWWCKSVDVLTNEPIKFGQFKPDKPIQFPDSEKPAKYLSPKQPIEVIALPVIDWAEVVKDPTIPIDITEGGKKAGCLLSLDRTALSLTGVWNQDIDVEIAGIKTKKLCPNLDALAVPHRVFNLIFDADLMDNDSVCKALATQAKNLINRQCQVNVIAWDKSLGKGIDDVIVQNPDRIAEILGNPIKFKDWLKSRKDQFTKEKPNKGKRNEIKKGWQIVQDEFVSRLKFNELKMTVELDGKSAKFDNFYLDLAIDYDITVSKNTAYDLVIKYAQENTYHPVQDYLNSISEKHNQSDLDISKLASRYLGTDIKVGVGIAA